jgi:hypothetical protein
MNTSKPCLVLFCVLPVASVVSCNRGVGPSAPTVTLPIQFVKGIDGIGKSAGAAGWQHASFLASRNSMSYGLTCGVEGTDGILSPTSICSTLPASPHPDFSGVWRLRGEAGAPSTNMSLMWISQKDSELDLKMFSQFEKRYNQAEAVFTIGKERDGAYVLMPAKFTANWDGEALVVEWTATWPWGDQTEHHRLTLNTSATELADAASDQFGSRIRQHSAVYDREPLETAKVFAYPEQSAGEHFKNIQIVKDIPSSALTPLMATFQTALGVQCEYCHNQSAYDSDKLETKVTARKMMSMVADLNRREFAGRQAVACITCHRGKTIPDQP